METIEMKECGKCGKCEIHNPDMENSYHGNWCCNILYCQDCDCDCEGKKDCCGCDMPVNDARPLTCEEEGCDNIFCDDCAPEKCEDCDATFCDDCEHLVECDDCLRLHCPEVECEDCAEEEEKEPCDYCDNTDDMTAYNCEKCEKKCCGDCDDTMTGDGVGICNKCAEIYEDDAEWAECYGVKTTKTKVYIMAGGGSHWWNYVVEFDDEHGEQLFVYIENKDGREQQFGMRLAYRHKINLEELRLVPLDWKPAEDKDEGLLTY